MKFECTGCGELVDAEDVTIVFKHAIVVGTSIYAYCENCYEKKREKNRYEKEKGKKGRILPGFFTALGILSSSFILGPYYVYLPPLFGYSALMEWCLVGAGVGGFIGYVLDYLAGY